MTDDPKLERLARLLDSEWRVPGTNFRFGLDALLGLVPGVGDSATALVSGAMMFAAWRAGAPFGALARMGLNIGIDWLVGLVPVLGDLFDVAFKANQRNMAILREVRANARRPTERWTSASGQSE